MQQRSIDSDFEDENEICYTSKRRAQAIPQHFDEDSLPSSSWTTNLHEEEDDDQHSSSIDYYHDDNLENEIFNLPPSSIDLPVPPQQALHIATIYEFLRHFSPILRLSPFLFEHFCTSIIQSNDINNRLFSQIHICILRLLIKQDDDDGITYASETDIKGIIDLSFVTMDYLTWPYILQLYVNSHPQLKYLSSIIKEYPFNMNLDDKIEILLALCDVVVTTKTIRREFDDTKPKQHDDNCRKCQKRGDLLCCDRCEATYHLFCLNPPLTSVPTIEWLCPVCCQNQIHGVSDCIPPRETRPFYLRHRCIGHDREQRRYWFVCRRLFVEDEQGEDVRYYSTVEEVENLLACLDEHGPERLLVYRLQKRLHDIARCMQITIDLQLIDNEQRIDMFTDGLNMIYFDEKIENRNDYEDRIERLKTKIEEKSREEMILISQIDGIVDEDDDDESETLIKNRDIFKMNLSSIKSFNRMSLEDRLRHEHQISSDLQIAIPRLNENDLDERIWQRYEQYRTKSIRGGINHSSYPRSNYYRDYYTGNNYEDEDGMLLDNEYDDFGDDFLSQQDEFDMPFRKYEYHRGTTRGRPRGRGRPPLYGYRNNRGHPPRGVNHLTTGSYPRLIQPRPPPPPLPSTTTTTDQQQPARNKRKPMKMKSTSVNISEEKPKRPGKLLRSGRISRKPRRDSETDFGSDNSDDSGAKDKETGSDDDEEFNLTQIGNISINQPKIREGSSSSTDSLVGTTIPLTNFAAFAQSQLLATNIGNSLNEENDQHSDYTSDGFESDESEQIIKNTEIIEDDFTYSQTMLSLINSMQPNNLKIELDLVSQTKSLPKSSNGHLTYENFYQTNPLATKKQMLLSERDRRAHLARKFSINHSPSFAWYAPSNTLSANYTFKDLSDILRLTLVHFENTVPYPFMHSHWKNYRYIWAKELLDFNVDLSLNKFIYLFLQFEACIKPVSYFDLFTDQIGYLKFRRETEKERDEAKKEEKDALIRRKIDADSIVQNVHFTRPLKHTVYKQRGEEYRLAGGQGWTFIRSTRRSIQLNRNKTFDINSLLTQRENMSNAITNERTRILNLLENQLKNDPEQFSCLLSTAKDDENRDDDDLTFIQYKIIEYNGISYRYPIMSEDTRRVFHLSKSSHEKSNRTNPFQLPLPWTYTYHSEIPANIFILPVSILRRLARSSMNLIDVPGFFNSKLSGIGTRFGWPYPCGRPSVRTAWCFKVQTSTSFFALAHHLKYLWNCIRWDLITEKLSNIDESSITTQVDNDGMTTTIQVLAKRDSGPYNSYCEYFVRKTIQSQSNDSSSLNFPISKSRSRAIPHPSSVLTPNQLIITEQWLSERQLQPNQIKYYYQCLLDKSFKRFHEKKKPPTKKVAQQSATPFIVRIPHLQPKTNLNNENGKVVLVKSSSETTNTGLPIQQKTFSVVKLPDGQIILVPTTNENKVIKPPSPTALSPKLRAIAPAPIITIQTSNDVENNTPQPPPPPPPPAVVQKAKNVRKTLPIISTSEEKKVKMDPEELLRMRICEAVIHSIIFKIEREQTQEAMKKRLRNPPASPLPKPDQQKLLRSRLLNERISHLRHEFLDHRRTRKTALVKEQVQIQRLKQQQKQQQAAVIKKEEPTLEKEQTRPLPPPEKESTPPVKKTKSTEKPAKRTSCPLTLPPEKESIPPVKKTKSTEKPAKRTSCPFTLPPEKESTPPVKKTKSTEKPAKRTSRPLPPPSSTEQPAAKKPRHSLDNDENRKSAKMKSTEKPKKIITIKNSSNKTEINLSDIQCTCQRTDLPDKFFVQCELCSRWLHGSCVGLTAKQAEKIKEFICEDCQLLTQKAKERLYCICQKPYDESEFYIGCDVCADWLHGSCMNITPEQAEKFEVYVCPRCSTDKKQEFLNRSIDNRTKKDLLNLTEQLMAHKMAWPFKKPVDIKHVPNYYTIIKEPMDLTTLKTKLLNSKFETVCDYIRDVNKIFNNCRQFNPINSSLSQCANVVDNTFRSLLENLMIKKG